MRIVLPAVGSSCSVDLVKNWLNHYIRSETTIPCCLYYDINTPRSIFDLWGDREKIQTTLTMGWKINTSPEFDYSILLGYLYVDTIKMYSYIDCGDCIVVDYDTIIKRKITEDLIPACTYGVTPHHRKSNYFIKKNYVLQNVTWLDEFDFLPWVNCGVQIFRKNCYNTYLSLLKKYMPRLYCDLGAECFGQTIISLTMRLERGVYISEDWNWYYDSSVENNSAFIEHYYGKEAKALLTP